MTQGPIDPLALWRDMLTRWQAVFDQTAGRSLAPAEFARFMNQTMGMSLQLQQTLATMMAKYLAALNLPTRADLAAMDARLRHIEDRIARLDQQVAKAAEKGAVPVPRTEPKLPRAKRAPQQRQPGRPEPAGAPAAAANAAAQPARAAKPARRTAKKTTNAWKG
jgi:hypothetical protein